MPTIDLPRRITGQELTDVIKQAAEEKGFKYCDTDGNISVSRLFQRQIPRNLRHAFDATLSLLLRFGEIESGKTYESLQCNMMLGAGRLQPADLDNGSEYKSYYNWFVQGIYSLLKQK